MEKKINGINTKERFKLQTLNSIDIREEYKNAIWKVYRWIGEKLYRIEDEKGFQIDVDGNTKVQIVQDIPTMDEMEAIVLDMPALDYLMAKWFHMYRIADTLTWIKFPPQEELRVDLQDETIKVMNLEYIWEDCTRKWQIQEAMKDESTFHEQMSLQMAHIGTKSYIKASVYGPYAAADISNSMFAQKRLDECRKWQELGLKMAKDEPHKETPTPTTR